MTRSVRTLQETDQVLMARIRPATARPTGLLAEGLDGILVVARMLVGGAVLAAACGLMIFAATGASDSPQGPSTSPPTGVASPQSHASVPRGRETVARMQDRQPGGISTVMPGGRR